MRLLTERDVRTVLPMPDLIRAMEQVIAEFSAGRAVQPVRTVMEIAPHQAFFGVMPAALADPPAMGAKLVTVYPHNHDRGLPSHLATIVLFAESTGALLAVLDGRYITEARTAAVSAVSVKHLARPDAAILAIVGSGVQARSHLHAIAQVRPVRDVRVWSPDATHREAFAAAARGDGVHAAAATTAREAIDGADIVVLATSSRVPVIDDVDVAPGTHICAVGACRPDQREMPSALIARARLFVDSRAGALKEAGDLLIPMREGAIGSDHIAGELGELVAAKVPARRCPDDVTIFKSLGMAVEDVAAARLAAERAAVQGLGRVFDLSMA